MSTSKLPPVAIESKLQPLSLNKIAEALKAAQLAKLSPLAQKELKNAAWIRIGRPEAGVEGEEQSQVADNEAALEQAGDVTGSTEAATRPERIEVAQAGPGAGPLMLAQAEAAAGASAGSTGAAAGSAAGAGAGAAAVTGAAAIGTTGLLAAVAAVGVAAAAGGSGGGSSSGTTTSTPAVAATTGTVIDGYLKGATVFIDKNGNGKLDSDEVSTVTDDKGNFSLPGGNTGRIIAFGGTDISTGLPFKGLLKAPEGSKVITPLTTLVNDMIAKQGSVAKAEEAVLKSLGLGSLDASIDLLNFDPVSAAGGSNAALKSAGLQLQKAGVLVANMVSDLTIKIQNSSGASDDDLDDIAHDIFTNFANQLTDDALTLTKISALGGALMDDVLNDSTIGGINVSKFKDDLEADKAAYSSNHQGFLDSIDDVTDLAEVGKLQEQNQGAPRLLNASVDGLGDVITLYFDRALDTANLPTAGQFTVKNGNAIAVGSLQVVNNQVILKLASAVSATQPVKVSFTDNAATNDTATVQDKQGVDARAFSDVLVENRLSLTENKSESFAHAATLSLAGAEISAFDPASDRIFVTSASGLQVIGVNKTLGLTLLGTVTLGSNDINSVAVKDGLVAVAVAATDKTQPGTVYFLKADAAVGAGMVQGSVTVGALPDMLTFSADGKKVLVVNEAEQATAATTTAQATVANPEGSVSIIDVSRGVADARVSTATFSAFNSKLASLKAAGVRLMAGEAGFENVTVAQDLEPEYLSISPDGKTAFVTLQENNAIAILDIDKATFTDIVPLGLKSFLGLPFDGSDRDGAANATAISLRTDQPVFGQYMPDAIASFKGADGRTYFVTANEGDDRDDFITPDETARVAALNLDATRFPNAAALKANTQIGRLTVSNAPGNNGDTDKDGDVDQIMAYGARSFTILNDKGVIVFDSGSHIEQFVSAGGAFTNKDGAGLFDDTRSDNKGPEPEGVAIGKMGDRTLAFIGLERGGGGVMIYDVTDPGAVKFVQYLRKAGDESPEGLIFVGASDSPSDKALLVVTNEVSNTVSVYQNQTFTLQLLHLSDGEAGLLAASTAPKLAALVDAFEDKFANSITLSGGDNFLPGPFLAGGTDSTVIDEINVVSGSTLAATATVPIAAVDTIIHNAIGVEASTIGNHEFDLGSRVFRDSFTAGSGYVGAQFPYLSSNLDFSGDADLSSRFTNTTTTAGLELASSLKGRIAPSAILEEGGQKIGLVGATTQIIEAISSPSGTEVKGFPTGPGSNGEVDNMELLAQQLQPVIDDLIAQGVNKIILMAHLQVIANEKLLATKLSGVDIILSAGSNTRLGDASDTAVAFAGHAATFADTYPLVIKNKDGGNTLIVNTDNEYTYLGRLVVDFDSSGNILTESLTANATLNGAYAATDANVAAAWGVATADLATTAFAAGTRGSQVKTLTDAVQTVISAKDGNVYGYSNVYLEGERANVRSEETNLGNLTADANRHAALQALGSAAATTPVVSIKNGGGIRAQIGTLSAPKADGSVDKLPPDGGVSQLDVENSLRFNNQLMMFDTTPEGLKAILEHGVAAGTLQGRFPQIGGVAFSWDPDFAVGSRVSDIALVADGVRTNLYNNGVKLDSAPAKISVVTLNFMANGGDAYPMKANGENFRYLIENANGTYTLSTAVDEARDYTAASVIQEYTTGATVDAAKAFAADTYLQGTAGRAAFREVISAGEKAGNGYVFNGIPDGLGVLDNGDGTLRVLVNHELGNTAGDVRAHGSKGAYVGELVIDKATLSVISGKDFLQSAANLYLASADGATWTSGATTAFNRFCSGDLAAATAFKTTTAGYDGRIYLTGEEAGAEGRAFAHILTGAEAGRVYELPALGNLSFENAVANHKEQAKTIVAALDDNTTNGQVYFYVGTKSTTGNAVEQAGLAGGKMFGVKVGSGAIATETGATPADTGLGLTSGSGSFSLVDLGDAKGKTGATLNTESIAAGVTNFLRPEDGAWSVDGKTFYFVTTASVTTASRLWALEFGDAANPEAGGTIKMLLDGSEGQIMMDNLTVAADGSILIQEDPGANDRLAKIWKYTPANDTLTEIAQHDPALFTGTAKLTNDEESSGIVEVTSMFTGVAGYDTTKYNYFLASDQIHKAVASPTSQVEMGQLSLIATAKSELLGEQDALATYMKAFHGTTDKAFALADTAAAQDTRIQNLNARSEEVLAPLAAPKLGFTAPQNSFDLANYSLTGRYALPADPTGANKLAHESSGITFNKDTGTLFVVGDGGTAVVQVSKQGALIDSMALAAGSSPQGTHFYDTEGIAYIGGGKFVMVEERDREFNEFTYTAGSTLGPTSAVRTVKLGTSIGNIGIEGLSYDPLTGGFLAAKEATPLGIFQTTVDFAAGTASNGSATTENSTNLFDPAKAGLTSLNDIFALSNVVAASAADASHFLLISAADGKLLKMDRSGNILGTLNVGSTAKNEGVTMDSQGNIYVVGEEGGGSLDKPEMLVYAPTTSGNAVGLGSNLHLTFNNAVSAGSGNIVISNGSGDTRTIAVGDATQVSISGTTVSINPSTDLVTGSTYTIAYGAGVFKDAAGANVAAVTGTSMSFKTVGDVLAPGLSLTSPLDNATGVNSNHIILTFNEAIKAGNGNIVISGTNAGGLTDVRTIAVGDVTQVTISGTTVDINPGADLRNGYAYNVQLASGVITDLAGNAFAGISTPGALNFTRSSGAATSPQTVLITEVNSNAAPADFFELYNYGTATVDLTGWKWDDDSASFTDAASAAFASGTTIAAGQRLVVAASADAAAFKTAWGLGSDVQVVATGGPGLGAGDAVVLFNNAGNAVTAFNYSGAAKIASDGASIATATAATGVTFTVGHAGAAYGGTASTSAVWDGLSTSAPAYKAAAVGTLGGFAQPAASANIGSPGAITTSTAADTTAPTLSSALPLDNAASVSVGANLTLTFSEAVKAGSGNIVVSNAGNAADTRTIAVTDTTQVSFSGGVLTINPTANLLPGAAYAVTLASGVIQDTAGNAYAGISDSTVLNFVTATSAPTLLITELNSNAGPEDFFELFNYGSAAITLSGWKWDDDSASFSDPAVATFAAGTSIAAGGRLLVIAGTDTAGFKTAWGLGSDVQVVSTGGPGLGAGDSVVIFNDGGSVVTSFNYSGTAKTASDGSSIAPSPASAGVTFASGHAGLAYGGTATTSAVWDGLSVTAPTYKAAVVGTDGGVAQAATAANIGSPGSVPALEVGDLLFTAANADPTDALAFMLLQAVAAGTQIGFTDRNYSATTGMPASGESAYLWTADKAYNAGTIVTIQPDVASGNPLTDKGTVQGAGGGLSTTAETIYAFKGSIASLVDGGAGAITVDKLLASLNFGGAAAGDVPASITSTSLSFTTDNAKYTGSTDATNVSALAALVANPANWTTNDTTAFTLTNGSLF